MDICWIEACAGFESAAIHLQAKIYQRCTYPVPIPCVFVFEHLYLCVWVCPFVFVYLYLESASIHLEAKIPPLSLPTVKGIGYLKVELNMLNAVNLYLTNQL